MSRKLAYRTKTGGTHMERKEKAELGSSKIVERPGTAAVYVATSGAERVRASELLKSEAGQKVLSEVGQPYYKPHYK